MTRIHLLLLFMLPVFVLAQTKPVAFRSHSGNMNFFSTAEPDNLGNPPIYDDTVYYYNDTSVIVRHTYYWGQEIDTVSDHPVCNNPEMLINELIMTNERDVYLGFDSVKKNLLLRQEMQKYEDSIQRGQIKHHEITPLAPGHDGNGNNHGFRWFFFLALAIILTITGTLTWKINRPSFAKTSADNKKIITQ